MTNISPKYDSFMLRASSYYGLISLILVFALALDLNAFNSQYVIERCLPLTAVTHFQKVSAANWMLIWLGITSLTLNYCARNALKGNIIGRKVYPASCVAYFLVLLMAYRWLQQPIG